jgi:hypothetical protein
MAPGDQKYAGAVMAITEGDRHVDNISFDGDELDGTNSVIGDSVTALRD